MELTDKDKESLAWIVEYEATVSAERWEKLGWTWEMVRVWPATLNRLIQMGIVEVVFHSHSSRNMKLTEEGKAIGQSLASSAPEPPQEPVLGLPDDIFGDIIGYEEVKELLKAAIAAEKPVHVLLAGPPALAKTLFLWDMERALGETAVWLVGSATSRAGLWDLIAERQPRVLLVDELDKMSSADTAALLSMMEGGRLVRVKVGRRLGTTVPLRVAAATNSLLRLSAELLSRFAVRKLTAYSRSDFLTVVQGVLVRREGVSADISEEIARKIDGRTQDVRDAVRVARLAPQVGVEKAVSLLLGS